MTEEKKLEHINFLEKILEQVSGLKHQAIYGKPKALRDKAFDGLDSAIHRAKSYLSNNEDLYRYMLTESATDEYHFESLEWKYIEGDFRGYLSKIRELKITAPDEEE